METLRTPLLNWPYYYQGKSIEELKHSLICTTLELETTKLAAQEEIRKREEQLTHLQELLNKAITEKNEAQENCKTLLLEKLYIQQQQQMVPPQVHSGSSSSIEDEPTTATTTTTTKRVFSKNNNNNNNNNGGNFSSSDGEESIISSPSSPLPLPLPLQPSPSALSETALTLLTPKKPLPEKGKLLQAVIKAGPLLQTLLLAGPLPQWRHPPPPLENFDIPPVTIPAAAVTQPELVHQQEFLPNVCGNVNRKRGFSDGFSSEASKYQRVLLH
ncbi:kinesin-related protein 12-like [Chenopodium quinoa]|uniref:kinesin-related protein 12-like n=1 Tax=Chenopodium quinoa TaxID=63459 RepID=UPI000B77B2C9|nr:kinesin-related protein 12-like [Chenopodium quinoa]